MGLKRVSTADLESEAGLHFRPEVRLCCSIKAGSGRRFRVQPGEETSVAAGVRARNRGRDSNKELFPAPPNLYGPLNGGVSGGNNLNVISPLLWEIPAVQPVAAPCGPAFGFTGLHARYANLGGDRHTPGVDHIKRHGRPLRKAVQ